MKKRIILSVLVLLVAIAGFFAWKFMGSAVMIKDSEKPYLYIRTGSTPEDVKKELTENGFLRTTTWYNMVAGALKYNTVRPGRYKLSQGMSLVDLVRMLRSGNQSPVNFTITKIRTKEVLASRIGNAFEADSLQMIRFLNNPDSLKKYDVDTSTVMIMAMPYTYSIKWNTTADGIFRQLHTAYTTFWTPERKQKAADHGLTPAEVSILASIIDEETNLGRDKSNIASVYINRIRKGMPLQADPTVKFALREFGLRRILKGHLDTPSPYNTYINRGLPPGPICTPQVETIDSVLNSPKTEYIYFVASSAFDGSSIFTTNYDDHLKYARLYQQELNKRKIK
jgi:UPF0755 protein